MWSGALRGGALAVLCALNCRCQRVEMIFLVPGAGLEPARF